MIITAAAAAAAIAIQQHHHGKQAFPLLHLTIQHLNNPLPP
jgi:hypothetical protein